jgi:hypothetical protein
MSFHIHGRKLTNPSSTEESTCIRTRSRPEEHRQAFTFRDQERRVPRQLLEVQLRPEKRPEAPRDGLLNWLAGWLVGWLSSKFKPGQSGPHFLGLGTVVGSGCGVDDGGERCAESAREMCRGDRLVDARFCCVPVSACTRGDFQAPSNSFQPSSTGKHDVTGQSVGDAAQHTYRHRQHGPNAERRFETKSSPSCDCGW